MNEITYCIAGIFIGYALRPFVDVIELVIKNAYKETTKSKS